MWSDYGVFGTQELWNNDRTYHYAAVAGIKDKGLILKESSCTMPLLYNAPPGNIYTNPVVDSAPWYDAAYPESADFAGIYVQSTPGFDTLGTRELTGNPTGTIASRRNMIPKTITVSAILIGSTCCATQYGYRWLLSKLLERDCVDNLETSQLSLYDCCPTEEERTGLTDQQIIDRYLRTAYNVKVASDPTIIQRVGTCCGEACTSTTLVVQWTFVPENHKLYRSADLCLTDSAWPETTECIDYECEPCAEDPLDTVYAVEVSLPKRRYPARVLANRTWCPVGDWEPSEYFDNPEQGYIDIVATEIEANPLNIYVAYDGTFRAYSYQIPIPDLTAVDLCKINFQITDFEQLEGASDVAARVSGGGSFQSVTAGDEAILPIRLVPSDSVSGTWEPIGWTRVDGMPSWPPNGTKIVIENGCGCVEHIDDNCEIQFNDDLTWSPRFDYVGTFPPLGCNTITAYNQSPGTYIVDEELTLEEVFNGGPNPEIQSDSYAGTTASYCQPVEWKQQCCKILFDSGVERAEPYLEYFSGSTLLYNFSADFYKLESADDTCLCDEDLSPEEIEEWKCRIPDFSIRAGRSIPDNTTLVYEPRTRKITGTYGGLTFDASGLVSGKNNGSPYFFEFPECYGMCVVFTAEVRRDINGDIISPAANATVSAGHIPFALVGV